MTEFEVTAGVARPEPGVTPSHQINIRQGPDIFTYWYVQASTSCRPFDKAKDRDLVELMHAKGQQFDIGQFESFAIGAERNYHLERLTRHEFLIKALR
jgi:hypothetical protein